jgi:hypothetical protein
MQEILLYYKLCFERITYIVEKATIALQIPRVYLSKICFLKPSCSATTRKNSLAFFLPFGFYFCYTKCRVNSGVNIFPLIGRFQQPNILITIGARMQPGKKYQVKYPGILNLNQVSC